MHERQYTEITSADDVTEEVLEMVRNIESGWYLDRRIDWEDVWDRLEGSLLADGTYIDLGPETSTPAMRKIKRVINEERREG